MADSSGGIGILGVIIGAALVIGVAFFFFGGVPGMGGGGSKTNITITAPKP